MPFVICNSLNILCSCLHGQTSTFAKDAAQAQVRSIHKVIKEVIAPHIHTRKLAHTPVHIHMHINTLTHICTHKHTHIHTQSRTHTHIHTHTQTHTQRQTYTDTHIHTTHKHMHNVTEDGC